MSMGHTSKFFAYSSSFTVLNILLFCTYQFVLLFFWRFYLFILRERGREGERGGKKHQCVIASYAPQLGTWPPTQVCALMGNVPELATLWFAGQHLIHTSQGPICTSYSLYLLAHSPPFSSQLMALQIISLILFLLCLFA